MREQVTLYEAVGGERRWTTPGSGTASGRRRPVGASAPRLVLEGDLHPGAVGAHGAVLDRHVELHDLGHAQVTQGLRSALDGVGRRLLPGLRAGSHDLADRVDAVRHRAAPFIRLRPPLPDL